jgi:hypothetical protein
LRPQRGVRADDDGGDALTERRAELLRGGDRLERCFIERTTPVLCED